MKVDSSRLIPRKLTINLDRLIDAFLGSMDYCEFKLEGRLKS